MKIFYILFFSLLTFSTNAAIILVTNTNDTGSGSLREAVTNASATDTIRFNPAILNGGSATITLLSEIAFSKSLVFKGLYNSMDTLYISGGNTNRHFNITDAGDVTIDSMVLVNGNSGTERGGSIRIVNSGAFSVMNSTISQNISGWGGGGISFFSNSTFASSVFVENSKIIDNTGTLAAGIFCFSANSSASVSVTNSTISGNNASNDSGGGIGCYSGDFNAPATVSVTNSTISGNNTTGSGGGIYCYGGTASVSVTNSTISANTANNGGGIYSYTLSTSSTVSLTNSTISENTANNGGGVYSYAPSTSINVIGSIIWTDPLTGTNISNDGMGINSSGYNIFSGAPSGYDPATDNINVTATDLNLEPLALNGGTTKTMLPGTGSIAINTGDPSDLSDAQNRIIVGVRDRGAAESFCVIDSTETITACESFTWRDGETYTSDTSGVIFRNWSSTSGVCDTVFTLNLSVNEFPDVTTTISGATINSNATNSSYQWIDCDNNNTIISGATNQSFTATVNGNYAVIVDKVGCVDTSDCITVSTVGVSENAVHMGIRVFPNPTNDKVTVSLESSIENEFILKLRDAEGRELFSKEMTSNTTELSLSDYSKGIYFIQVLGNQSKSTYRVVKE